MASLLRQMQARVLLLMWGLLPRLMVGVSSLAVCGVLMGGPGFEARRCRCSRKCTENTRPARVPQDCYLRPLFSFPASPSRLAFCETVIQLQESEGAASGAKGLLEAILACHGEVLLWIMKILSALTLLLALLSSAGGQGHPPRWLHAVPRLALSAGDFVTQREDRSRCFPTAASRQCFLNRKWTPASADARTRCAVHTA
ncbi:hypothetical protein H920_17199 [Fukomys damarensis]|uniref:Uncharacterized protein n=1 Tax=Fukomys damarensis TaxID=885580 RepID=A0A091CUP4_FUKDA|nr:hypothetical protein H920_17199 [Fukomys damarensis]